LCCLSMACPPAASCSYTVVLIPLRSSLCSLDALRFYLWHLKDLEKEKDILYCGLEILEQARLWYRHRLEKSRTRQDDTDAKSWVNSCREGVAKHTRLTQVSTNILHVKRQNEHPMSRLCTYRGNNG
uniref:Suppressor APC domain containing 1 n=1 Tax=Hippocampus comes TaxID=109280 RepID=A0A3Q2XZV4_HIPCM